MTTNIKTAPVPGLLPSATTVQECDATMMIKATLPGQKKAV
ncbi:MAG TPA: hypothetical protein VF610_07345 [Segetibacter sp.]